MWPSCAPQRSWVLTWVPAGGDTPAGGGKRRAMHAQVTRRRGARDMVWGVWREGRVLSRGCTERR
eukprot:1898996-Prymnesium_polylepis.1